MFDSFTPPGNGVKEGWTPDEGMVYVIDLTPMLPSGRMCQIAFVHQRTAPAPNEWMATRGTEFLLLPPETVGRLIVDALRAGYRAGQWDLATIQSQFKYANGNNTP